ncbi:MAG: hypothetical protein WC816_14180 [Sphingomonas sp.]
MNLRSLPMRATTRCFEEPIKPRRNHAIPIKLARHISNRPASFRSRKPKLLITINYAAVPDDSRRQRTRADIVATDRVSPESRQPFSSVCTMPRVKKMPFWQGAGYRGALCVKQIMLIKHGPIA